MYLAEHGSRGLFDDGDEPAVEWTAEGAGAHRCDCARDLRGVATSRVRAVVDTNILVSGLREPRGKPARVLDLVRGGVIPPLYDPRMFAEYEDVLRRPRLLSARRGATRLLGRIRRAAESFVTAGPVAFQLPDPKDQGIPRGGHRGRRRGGSSQGQPPRLPGRRAAWSSPRRAKAVAVLGQSPRAWPGDARREGGEVVEK